MKYSNRHRYKICYAHLYFVLLPNFKQIASENVGEYILSRSRWISKNSHNSACTDKLEHYISFTMLNVNPWTTVQINLKCQAQQYFPKILTIPLKFNSSSLQINRLIRLCAWELITFVICLTFPSIIFKGYPLAWRCLILLFTNSNLSNIIISLLSIDLNATFIILYLSLPLCLSL